MVTYVVLTIDARRTRGCDFALSFRIGFGLFLECFAMSALLTGAASRFLRR